MKQKEVKLFKLTHFKSSSRGKLFTVTRGDGLSRHNLQATTETVSASENSDIECASSDFEA